jgi:hypothetical protein
MIKDVAYNTGGPISGTTQVNNIAIGIENPDYTSGSWVGGVDDTDGYVIVGDTTTAGLVGRTTGGGTGVAPADTPTFWKSAGLTDQDLVDLINKLPGSDGNYTNVTDARTALSFSPYAIVNDYNIGGAGWLFYSDEGNINAQPPGSNGNAIFVTNTNVETFNPNEVNGKALYFNRYDSNGLDYETQFTTLQVNGGTLSITQNGNTVTYTTTNPNMFIYTLVGGVGPCLIVNTGILTQTAYVVNPFVYGDPITLSFS